MRQKRTKPRRIKIERACRIYWKLHGSKRKSWRNYRFYLSKIQEFFEGRYIDEITYLDVEDYRRLREQRLSPTSVNKEHTVITHIYNQLERWAEMGKIKPVTLPRKNPGSMVRKARLRTRKRILSQEEIADLLEASTPEVQKIVTMALNSLLRFKDLRLLRKSQNVNKMTNCLEGIQAKTGVPYKVPINDPIQKILDDASGDRILSLRNFRKEWEETIERVGLLYFQFRDLRRTGARYLLKHGYDLATVQAMLGHTDIRMTQIYVQAEDVDLQKASQFLGGITTL